MLYNTQHYWRPAAQLSPDKKDRKRRKDLRVGCSLSFADEAEDGEESELLKKSKLGKNPNVVGHCYSKACRNNFSLGDTCLAAE